MAEPKIFDPILGKTTEDVGPFRTLEVPLLPVQKDPRVGPYTTDATAFLDYIERLRKDKLEQTNGEVDLFPKGDTPKADALTRFAADVKEGVSSVGQINYMKSVYGNQNVFADKSGNIVFRQGPGYAWTALDPDNFALDKNNNLVVDWLEPFEASSEMINYGPAMFSVNPVTVALTSAGGDIALQYVSSLFPGDENLTLEDRASSVLSDAVLGGSTQWGVNQFLNWVTKVNPVKNFATKEAVKIIKGLEGEEKRLFFEEGLRLQEKIGPLTLSEISGVKFLRQIEDFLRGYYLTRGQGADLAFEQIESTAVAIQNLMKQLYGKTGKDVGILGNKITGAYEDILDNLIKQRKDNADIGFENLTKLVNRKTNEVVDFGDIPMISTDNFVAKLDTLIKQYKPKGTGDDTLYRSLIDARASMVDDTGGANMLTALEFQNLISQYSAAAAGTGSVFKDLATAAQKRPARELLDALNIDLDQTIANGLQGNVKLKQMSKTIQSEIAQRLQDVRSLYKTDSDLIKALEDSFLSKFIESGKSAEDVVTQFTKLNATELDEALTFLRNNGYDDVINQLKSTVVEDALLKSSRPIEDLTFEAEKLAQASEAKKGRFGAYKERIGKERVAGAVPEDIVSASSKFDGEVFKSILDPTLFVKNITNTLGPKAGSPKTKLDILFSKEEISEIADLFNYIRRVNFNRVSPKASMLDIVLGFVNLQGLAARAGGMNYLSKMLLTKQGRDGLKTFIDLQTGALTPKNATKNQMANAMFFVESMMGYQTDLATGIATAEKGTKEPTQEYTDFLKTIETQDIQPGARFPSTPPKPSNNDVMNIPRGLGANVVPPLSAPFNPQTVASLESVGMPLFNAAEGGIVDIYESKKFKRPQVVA